MRLILFLFFIVISGFANQALGQDTLPRLSVKKVSTKVIISWKNNYGANIKTINIQRSYDSTKMFTTIGSVLNPMNRDNGFVDTKPPYDKMYYRVFIAFEGGDYLFTRSYMPTVDTSTSIANLPDAIFSQPTGFVASKYIYTGKDNNVIINLPNALTKKYSAKFYDLNNKFLFELKKIPQPYITLEKVNFKHAGWFNFQLFEDDQLIEKYQFYISKDSKKNN
ncbi:MAG: hypothetical protein V4556_12965 [Bacteroidota bacterium]